MTLFEQLGGTYRQVGDYQIPNLTAPEEGPGVLGKYALLRKRYLKQHRRVLYLNFVTTGPLNAHLMEIEQAANDRMELLSKQMAEREGVTEQLKAENQLLWVQRMNNIHNRVDEIIREELIYA
ncbi:MAG: TnpV protein [Oscillospiraceae bacterium]|nr:TnpV protein [Oscillospiraceae bacterium]